MQRSRTLQTILVIEDYADSREMLRLLLENLDYRVITAKNGREALAVAAEEHLDLVLADLGLPDMSGLTVVRLLRRLSDHLKYVPIIMLTAFNDHYRSAIEAGCTAFLTKPADFDNLQATIERLLSKSVNEHNRLGRNSPMPTMVLR